MADSVCPLCLLMGVLCAGGVTSDGVQPRRPRRGPRIFAEILVEVLTSVPVDCERHKDTEATATDRRPSKHWSCEWFWWCRVKETEALMHVWIPFVRNLESHEANFFWKGLLVEEHWNARQV